MNPDFMAEINRLLREHNSRALDTERADAKADPLAHKLTRVMEGKHGLSYHYWPAGKDGRGRSVWFCWSTHRNAAGFFLGWREVRGKTGGKRDQWLSRRKRQQVEAIAKRRAEAWRRKRTPVSDSGSQG